jgi:hypothetical protein
MPDPVHNHPHLIYWQLTNGYPTTRLNNLSTSKERPLWPKLVATLVTFC